MLLNIGCGFKKLEGYINVDCEKHVNPDVLCDLAREEWPFATGSMNGGVCSHVMEHIGEGFFHFLQEMYRVSAPGAIIKCAVPHPRHDIFLKDPTHVRPIFPDTMLMFSKRQCEELAAQQVFYTPFWKYIGVDFEIDKAFYAVDDKLPDCLKEELKKDFWFCEQHYNNIVFEIQFELKAIK